MEEDKMTTDFEVIAIGGSAGSLDVLMKILPQVSAPIACAVVIILHRKSAEDSTLEEVIAFKSPVTVIEVEDKTPLLPGYLYIAPSDYHLLFEKGNVLSLDASEKINYSRPSIDVAFTSAAAAFGARLTGILLSGANADGTQGLKAIREAGGTVVIQDPKTADIDFMPKNAMANIVADHILDIQGITGLLNDVANRNSQ
jgi:two-component system chemotaxis response regulator CheB